MDKKLVVVLFVLAAAVLTACGGASKEQVAALETRVAVLEAAMSTPVVAAPVENLPADNPAPVVVTPDSCAVKPETLPINLGIHADVWQSSSGSYMLSFWHIERSVASTMSEAGVQQSDDPVWIAVSGANSAKVISGWLEDTRETPIEHPFVLLYPQDVPQSTSSSYSDYLIVGPIHGIAVEIITDPQLITEYISWASCLVTEDYIYILDAEELPADVFLEIHDLPTFSQ